MSHTCRKSQAAQASGAHVRTACASDLPSIARLHLLAFPGFFLAELGRSFLIAYYRTILDYSNGLLLVAERNERIIGFASGFVDSDAFYAFMSRRKWRYALPASLGVLRNPSLLKRFLNRSREVISNSRHKRSLQANSCELSSLAVNPENMGQNMGKLLVKEFLYAAAKHHAPTVHLTTDAKDNEKVNQFYRGLGFSLSCTFDLDGTRPMNEYTISVSSWRC